MNICAQYALLRTSQSKPLIEKSLLIPFVSQQQDSPSSQLQCPYYSVSQAESMRLCSFSVGPSPITCARTMRSMDEHLYRAVLLSTVTLVNRWSLILGGGRVVPVSRLVCRKKVLRSKYQYLQKSYDGTFRHAPLQVHPSVACSDNLEPSESSAAPSCCMYL